MNLTKVTIDARSFSIETVSELPDTVDAIIYGVYTSVENEALILYFTAGIESHQWSNTEAFAGHITEFSRHIEFLPFSIRFSQKAIDQLRLASFGFHHWKVKGC